MSKDDALKCAIEKQAQSLDPAQRGFIMAEFGTYRWNARKIASLEGQLDDGVFNSDGNRNYDAEAKLFKQRHQLVAEQSSLFSHIMRWLKGTAAEESAIDAFLNG